VKIIQTNTFADAIDKIISEAVSRADGSRPIFVIVPDRFTLRCEQMMLEGTAVLLNVRVLTFSMLFNLVRDELGCEKTRILDKTSSVLFMWRAIQNVAKDLKWFARSSGHYSFAEKMFNAKNQLTSSMVNFSNLEKNAKSEITQKKMRDIALIHAEYKRLIGDFTDSSGMLGFLIENLKRSSVIKSAHVFIAGFDHLSLQRMAVMDEIVRYACECTIGVVRGSEFAYTIDSAHTFAKQPKQLNIKIIENNNINDEAGRIANMVRQVIKSGADYRDIVVVLCDYESTREIFAQAFNQCGIPVNMDVGISIDKSGVGNFVQDILKLGIRDNAENFVTVIKSRFVGIDKDLEFELEAFCLKTGYGLKGAKDRADKILVALGEYLKKLRSAKKVGNICDVLGEIIGNFVAEVEGSVEELAIKKILQILGTVKDVLGETRFTLDEFMDMLNALMVATKLSSPPAFVNRVLLVDVREFVPSGIPYMFVCGAGEKSFPTPQDDTDIITEFDIKHMKVKIEPSPSKQNARSRRHAWNIVECSIKGMVISYSISNSQNEIVARSEIVEKILERNPQIFITEDFAKDVTSEWYAKQRLLRDLGTGEAFMGDAKFYNSLKSAVGNTSIEILDLGANEVNIKDGNALFFGKSVAKVTQLEKFYACPYLHFLEQGLGVRVRERHKVEASVIGNIIHAIVEEFLRCKIKGVECKIDDIVLKILSHDDFKFFANDSINKPIIEALKKECRVIAKQIIQNIEKGEYLPKYIERRMETKIGDVSLIGKADRVDVAKINGKKHAFIIDYKTGGNVNFSFRDLYIGTKLQLPLYLSFFGGAGYTPGGAVYMPLKGGFSKETMMRGIVNADYNNAIALDRDLASVNYSSGIVVLKNKQGEIDKGQTVEQIYNITCYARYMAERAVNDIQSGYIMRSSSCKKTCEYCLARCTCTHKEDLRAKEIKSQSITAKVFEVIK